MSIIEHAHMWVPWDARRMNVCDKTDCGAATSWDATGVFDWWEWTTERLNDLLTDRLTEAMPALVFAALTDPDTMVVMPLTEPGDGATDEQRKRWERSCDLCDTYCPHPVEFWTGSMSPEEPFPIRVRVTVGFCGPCRKVVTP